MLQVTGITLMTDNQNINIPKTIINERSVVYNSWTDFWNDMCHEQFGINVPIRFFWSGDSDLDLQLMSIHVAQLEQRSIVECIINNVSRQQFSEYTSKYKKFFNEKYDKELVKTLEDY